MFSNVVAATPTNRKQAATDMSQSFTERDEELYSGTRDYQVVNRRGWAYLVRQNCDSCVPYGSERFAHAYDVLDPNGWIPWDEVNTVLCLAAGGGQQAPLLASLGYHVTSVDLSPEQLQRDREEAAEKNLVVECIEADMLDLSLLHGRDFDLVYQPISACYVPDVGRLYQEVASVLRPGGSYHVEHWSPVSIQAGGWTGQGYHLAQPQASNVPVSWTIANVENSGEVVTCWHYIHSLDQLIGGLCDTGFALRKFAESQQGDLSAAPGSHAHLAAYVPPFFTLFAQRL